LTPGVIQEYGRRRGAGSSRVDRRRACNACQKTIRKVRANQSCSTTSGVVRLVSLPLCQNTSVQRTYLMIVLEQGPAGNSGFSRAPAVIAIPESGPDAEYPNFVHGACPRPASWEMERPEELVPVLQTAWDEPESSWSAKRLGVKVHVTIQAEPRSCLGFDELLGSSLRSLAIILVQRLTLVLDDLVRDRLD